LWGKTNHRPSKRGRSFPRVYDSWRFKTLIDDRFDFRDDFLRFTFLQMEELSGKGRFESGEKIDALQPLLLG